MLLEGRLRVAVSRPLGVINNVGHGAILSGRIQNCHLSLHFSVFLGELSDFRVSHQFLFKVKQRRFK